MDLVDDLKELQKSLAEVDMRTSRTPETRRTRSSHEDCFALLLLKLGDLKFKMYQEAGHHLPHIHIDYGRQSHVATYCIEPATRLVGTLDGKYDRAITEWISNRKGKLLETWALLQTGSDPSPLLLALAGDA